MSPKILPKHLSALRRIIQAVFALFCLYAGWRFYHFYEWALGKSDTYVARPPSVEAFLPISALMGLKKLVLTGQYDPIHPAGLTIFIAAITIAFCCRKSFCGWICPVGFSSHLTQALSTKLRSLFHPPYWAMVPGMTLKYLLLFFFIYMIVIKMNIKAIDSFMQAPYNITVDAKMLAFFLVPSRLAGSVLIFLLISSFIIKNFWCRFLCPYGAMLGMFALFSPLAIVRNHKLCIDCKRCNKVCPGEIEISSKARISSPECIGCLECIAQCPKRDCLTLCRPGSKKINPFILPVLTMVLFLLFWLGALASGHWHSTIPLEILQKYYQLGLTSPHP